MQVICILIPLHMSFCKVYWKCARKEGVLVHEVQTGGFPMGRHIALILSVLIQSAMIGCGQSDSLTTKAIYGMKE